MNTLRITAPAAEGAMLRWWRLDDGRVQAQGDEPVLARQAEDARIELILPAERVALVPVPLSAEQQARLSEDNLPWLIEPYVAQDVERLHLARGDTGARGEVVLAAVDRGWLEGVLARLAARDLRPDRIIPEIFLGDWQEGDWIAVLRAAGGYLRTGRQGAVSLDVATAAHPPATLQRALAVAAPPQRLRLVVDDGGPQPDLAAWSVTLGMPLQAAGARDWSVPVGDGAIELARGPFAPPGRGARGWRRAKLPLALAALLLAVNLIGWSIHGIQGALERARLRQAIESELVTTFPETKVVLDPLLQMRQGVERRARESGAATPGDLLPLLGRVGQAAGPRLAGKTESLQFEPGRLSLEISLPDSGSVDSVRTAWQSAGMNVKVETLGGGAGTPVKIRASVTP